MAQITASLVKALREKSSAGMMDCKKALTACDGDIEKAVDWLRKNGLATAAKKAGRVAAEGLVAIAVAGGKGALVEINSETDFVSRNPDFQTFVRTVADGAVSVDGNLDALAASPHADGGTVSEQLTQLVATIGENITLRRCAALAVNQGIVAHYIHGAVADGLGRIAVLVALESAGDSDKLAALGKQLAMHVAASGPRSVSTEDLDPDVVARERNVLVEQARASGRPDDIIEKMVEGRLRKFYEEVVLLEQTFVIDGESKVKDIVAKTAEEIGAPISVGGFVCYRLGEGIEREATDFAAEVAAQVGG